MQPLAEVMNDEACETLAHLKATSIICTQNHWPITLEPL